MAGAWHPDSPPWYASHPLVSGDWKRDLKEGRHPALFRAEPIVLVRAVGDPADRSLDFVCSTEGVKADGYSVRIGDIGRGDEYGFDFREFAKNPVMLWCHDYGTPERPPAPQIGSWSNWRIETFAGKRCLAARAYFARWSLADIAYQLYLPRSQGGDGCGKACSIGWTPEKYVEVTDERGAFAYWDMLVNRLWEISACPLGKDPDALLMAMRGEGPVKIPADLHGRMGDWFNLKNVVRGRAYVLSSRGDDDYEAFAAAVRAEMGDDVEDEDEDEKKNTAATEKTQEQVDFLLSDESPLSDEEKAKLKQELEDGTVVIVEKADDEAASKRAGGDEQALRWNRQLSRAWDVTKDQFYQGTPDLGLAARYFDCEIREITEWGDFIPSARMGAFFAALDETLAEWRIDGVRRVEWDNNKECPVEYPPEFETIRLNSKRTGEFLVSGTRFMRNVSEPGVRALLKVERGWQGASISLFCVREQRCVIANWYSATQRRAADMKLLRGEAFSLGGEFLERADVTWDDLFLERKTTDVLQRQVALLNEKGANLTSRGIILAGPPGTGKTLAGRVMMSAAKDATFIWISARDLYYAGAFGGFAYAFDLARENTPTILFVEDVDNFFRSDTIDLLKSEMDGLAQRNAGIVTVLTTNFPERLPRALIDRPGRFHDVLEIGLPGPTERSAMLARWLPELTDDDARQRILDQTDGYSGAHMREFANFVRTIREQDAVELPAAVDRALSKIAEQREFIDRVQAGEGFRPSRALETDLERIVVRRAEARAAGQAAVKRSEMSDQCDVAAARLRAAFAALGAPFESVLAAVNALHYDDRPPTGNADVDNAKAAWKQEDVVAALRALNVLEALVGDLAEAAGELRALLSGADEDDTYEPGAVETRPESATAAFTQSLVALRTAIDGRTAGDPMSGELLELCARLIRIGKKIAKSRRIELEGAQNEIGSAYKRIKRVLLDAADGELDGKIQGEDDEDTEDGETAGLDADAVALKRVLDDPAALEAAMPPAQPATFDDIARAVFAGKNSSRSAADQDLRDYVSHIFDDAA